MLGTGRCEDAWSGVVVLGTPHASNLATEPECVSIGKPSPVGVLATTCKSRYQIHSKESNSE